MCIMEVRAGEHTTTQIQAEYHNLQTVVTDLDMLEAVMKGRRAHEEDRGEDAKVRAYDVALRDIRSARKNAAIASGALLRAYQELVYVADNPDTRGRKKDDTPEVVSTLSESELRAWEHDSAVAARYETR